MYLSVSSFNLVLIFVKMLRYLSVWFARVAMLFRTLANARSDIFYFLIMYLIIFFAFVVMCHLFYGSDVAKFGTIGDTLMSLFIILLGDLNSLNAMLEFD